DPLDCARRELAEETGYRAASIEPLVRFYSTPGFCTELMHIFLARDLTAGETNLDENEKIELEIMPYDAVLKAMRDGLVIDGKTIAALLYYDRFRKQRS